MRTKINTIYNECCFSFLPRLKNCSVDLAVLDPPYNLEVAEWDKFQSHEEFLDFTFGWIDLLIPKLKRTGSLYLFNTAFNSAYILQHLMAQNLKFQNWIVWNKRDGLSAPKRKYANAQEVILFFTTSDSHTFNYDDIRVPYESTERMAHAARKGIIKNGKRWYPNPDGKLCPDVWHFSSERHKKKVNGRTQKLNHLTPKPTALIERIIKASSNVGDLVLDCFMGCGTTAMVSKANDRNFIGCESDRDYHKICMQKLNGAV